MGAELKEDTRYVLNIPSLLLKPGHGLGQLCCKLEAEPDEKKMRQVILIMSKEKPKMHQPPRSNLIQVYKISKG